MAREKRGLKQGEEAREREREVAKDSDQVREEIGGDRARRTMQRTESLEGDSRQSKCPRERLEACTKSPKHRSVHDKNRVGAMENHRKREGEINSKRERSKERERVGDECE